MRQACTVHPHENVSVVHNLRYITQQPLVALDKTLFVQAKRKLQK